LCLKNLHLGVFFCLLLCQWLQVFCVRCKGHGDPIGSPAFATVTHPLQTSNTGKKMDTHIQAPSELINHLFCLATDYFDPALEKLSFALYEREHATVSKDLVVTLHNLAVILAHNINAQQTTVDILIEDYSDYLHQLSLIENYSLVVGMNELHFEAFKLKAELVKGLRSYHA